MNLTELSNENIENYNRYLNKMSKSYKNSSKGLIPTFSKGKILDVGCGSGILLENLTNAEGIDLNQNSVDICKLKGLRAECKSLKDVTNKYDTIIFSSVLHEISSYDEDARFTKLPIIYTLNDAKNILNDNGQIIIRDGLQADFGLSTLEVKSKDIIDDIIKYFYDAPMYIVEYIKVNGNKITANNHFLKEFMFTYTWGKDSYYREVQEKYGILRKNEWIELVESVGFKIKFIRTFKEEYIKYLSKYFIINEDLIKLFTESTIFIVAKK